MALVQCWGYHGVPLCETPLRAPPVPAGALSIATSSHVAAISARQLRLTSTSAPGMLELPPPVVEAHSFLLLLSAAGLGMDPGLLLLLLCTLRVLLPSVWLGDCSSRATIKGIIW